MERGELKQFSVNGCRVLFFKNTSNLTNIQILTDVGSAAETPPIYGMAHILEHMFFKGSAKRPKPSGISRAANDIGGKMNAYTAYDHTAYYITVLNDSFEEGFDILADMYQNPLFPAEEFRKEINPILSEYREREDDPDNFIFENALQAFLGKEYHPIIGTEETIRAANSEKMHEFKNSYYGNNNCLISVVGGIDEERVRRTVANLFPTKSSALTPQLERAKCQAGEISLTKPGIQEAYYTLLFPALPARDPGRYSEDMMNYLLGGNDSSLLFERIREDLGLSCYGIYSWPMRYDSFSVLAISCGIAPDELETLDREVRGCIERICEKELDEEFLRRGKASLRTSIAARSETSGGMNSLIGIPILKGEKEHPVRKTLAEIEKVTADDVLKAARIAFSGPSLKAVLLPVAPAGNSLGTVA